MQVTPMHTQLTTFTNLLADFCHKLWLEVTINKEYHTLVQVYIW